MTDLWREETTQLANHKRGGGLKTSLNIARGAVALTAALCAVTVLTLILFSVLSNWETVQQLAHGPQTTADRTGPKVAIYGSRNEYNPARARAAGG